MTAILGLLFTLLALIFYILKKRFTSPLVLAPSSWGITLILYGIVNHGMPSLSLKVLLIIFLWTSSVIIGVLIFNYRQRRKFLYLIKVDNFVSNYNLENNSVIRKNLNIYFWIAVLFFFPQVYLSYKQAMSGGDNLFLNMRLVSAGLIESEYSVGAFGYGKTFTIVCLLVSSLIYKESQSKIKIYTLFFMYFVLSILAVGKSQFLFLIISVLLVWSFTKKISRKYVLIGFSFILIIFASLQLARADTEDDKDDVISVLFYTYMFGGLPALDLVVNSEMVSHDFGQNSLQFFSRFSNAILNSSTSNEQIYENDISYEGYFYVPNPTNVSTVIGPFWLDFGYYGVVIFGFFYGILFGFLYNKALQMYIYGIVTYCLFVSALILPFFGEFIFAYLSYFIQVVVLSYLVDRSFFKFFFSSNNLNNNYYP